MTITSQLILNSENYDTATGEFILKFGQQQTFNDMQMALASLSIFNSFGNVSAELGNNTLTIYFPDGATHKAYPITIADGFYTMKTFNTWLLEKMEERYLYTLENDTKIYPIFFGENNSYQHIAYFNTVRANATIDPLADWSLPTVTSAPYIVWPLGLAKLFGFEETQVGLSSASVYLKSTTVSENSINSIVVTCNLVNSSLSYPRHMISSFPIGGTGFGDIFNLSVSKLNWHDIQQNGAYNELVVSFHDQNLKKIKILDTNVLILLSFRKK